MTTQSCCQVEPVEKPLNEQEINTATVAYLGISGMGCSTCATRVKNGLLKLEGVLRVEVQLNPGIAAAAYQPSRVDPDALIAAVTNSANDGRHNYSATLLDLRPAGEVFQP